MLHSHRESHLRKLRAAGVPLRLGNIRGYMVGVIQHEAPEIFTQRNQSGRPYRLPNSSVRRFLHDELGWSLRQATRAAQKTPSNATHLIRQSFVRLACLIRDEEIPACCIVNADQTQVVYSAGSGSSWNQSGERQVSVLGADEKRAFTLMVGISMSGKVLPLQGIYAGKTTRSVPDSSSNGFERARTLGFQFLPSLRGTYWSTLSTMQSYVNEHLAPYFRNQICIHDLPANQRCVFQIDCWALHRSAEFRNWMSTNYPWIVLQYVPGGCTGLFQACDVVIQRVLKLAIRDACHEDVVNETLTLLESGALASEILNDTTLKTLRNRSVRWILEGYDAINDEELVKKAFRLCEVPGTTFNLSYESLTSREAKAAILELRTSDPALYAEITSGCASAIAEQEGELKDAMVETATEDEDILDISAPELRQAILDTSSPAELATLSLNDIGDDITCLDNHLAPTLSLPTQQNAQAGLRRSVRLSRR
ncbi:DDE superfamily endonuclease [Ceratobasidium sp. AG-Ba]|nr:DDE superfamily endonuclease [Ceratobasidium sp. AG-Ba]QRW06832.1 DDE superfamily endonuclease [Ceratobasidium sp. AG-Ba]